jgi:hypothetical protein
VRAAVKRSREGRIRAIERRLNARLDQLRRVGRAEHDELVAMLRRVTARAGRRAGCAGRRR